MKLNMPDESKEKKPKAKPAKSKPAKSKPAPKAKPEKRRPVPEKKAPDTKKKGLGSLFHRDPEEGVASCSAWCPGPAP